MTTKHVVFASEKDAEAYQEKCDKLFGLPRRGVHIGGGRHVDLDDPSMPGWTIHYDAPRKHPSKDEWAHASVDPAVDGDSSKLDAAEIADLEAKKATEVELTEDWEPDVEIAPEPAPDPRIIG